MHAPDAAPAPPPTALLVPVAVDIVALTIIDARLNVLVVDRALEPFKGEAALPGGFLLAGEQTMDAARRELAEETGITVDAASLIGPVINRSSRFRFNLVTCRQDELFYLLHLDGVAGAGDDLDRSGWTELERQVLDSLRWWPLDELDAAAAAGMTVYPAVLPALARELLSGWDGVVRVLCEED